MRTVSEARPEWANWIELEAGAEVGACPADSAVGEDCLATIDAADALLARLLDIAVLEPTAIGTIKSAVARQCRVYWFG